MSDLDQTPSQDQSEPVADEATLEEAKKSVEGLDERYRPGARPTVAMPGTNGTVSGTAFADMVDDNGEARDNSDGKDENFGAKTDGQTGTGDDEQKASSTTDA